jgi:hypothetical protein
VIELVKYRWELEDIDDCVIVTRVVDSGEEAEDGATLLRTRRISRQDAFQGINEIRVSLDLLEKELRNGEAADKERKIVEKLKK